MGRDLVLEHLEKVARGLQEELQAVPQYQMLREISTLIEKRRAALVGSASSPFSSPPSEKKPSAREGTTAAAVIEAATEYLRSVKRRAQTPEIANEILRREIKAGRPENIIATVSSYLSTARDVFDNVKGEGYGLLEWKDDPNAPAGSVLVDSRPIGEWNTPSWGRPVELRTKGTGHD